MNRRGPSSRAAAARRAQEAKAGRDAERRAREAQIEAALTDYYQATAEAERIRAAARRKAEHLAADAERAAERPVTAARDAIRRLKDLLGGTAEVARLCGITPAQVRDILAAGPEPGTPAPGDSHDGGLREGGSSDDA